MTVPFVDLQRLYRPLHSEMLGAFKRVLESGRFVQGEEVATFEAEFAEMLGAGHALAVNNGTSALHLALAALGIGPGDEVLVPANTFIATAEAVTLAGARPVFVDVAPETLNIDAEMAAAAVTPRTRAITAVHLYGRMADMSGLRAVANRYALTLIEDACQAHGARLDDRAAGTIGDVGCFSFYPTKNLGAVGEGGMVVTSDGALASRMAALRDHGQASRYVHMEPGFNYRMAEAQAAMLRVVLPRLPSWNARRIRAADAYRALIHTRGLRLPGPEHAGAHVYHLFVVRSPSREALRAHLEERGVATAVHYPTPVHLQPAYASTSMGEGSLPVAEAASAEILSLPMHPTITLSEIQTVAEAINAFKHHESEPRYVHPHAGRTSRT